MLRWFLSLNRHLRIAILVAPFLMIFGYGLADIWMGADEPKPQINEVEFFNLGLQGDCQLNSRCHLTHEALSLDLSAQSASSGDLYRIDIRSSGHLRGLQMTLVNGDKEELLVAQETRKTDHWYVEFPKERWVNRAMKLRLAAAQSKRIFAAEVLAQF